MIYLGMSLWEGMWRSRQQLMSRFARAVPVLYVEPAKPLKKVRSNGFGVAECLADLKRETIINPQDGLYVFRSPAHLAVSGSRLLAGPTESRWLRAIRRAAGQAGIVRPILWVSRPEQRFAVGELGEFFSIYHVVDEYAGYTMCDEKRRRSLEQQERQLLDAVDLVITVSTELMESKAGPERDVCLVENAVDFQAFRDASDRRLVPEDLAAIERPRLGYAGLIGKRLDLDLLESLARAHPGWSIVLIGMVDPRNCEDELARLSNLRNMHFLGQKDHARIAAYVAGLDVGLLPYALNVETANISPLKMYEYLAAGIPIVSTAIPAAERKAALVTIAADTRSFIAGCEKVFLNGDSTRQARIAEASLNTWEKRIEELSTLIIPRLPSGANSAD